MFFQFNSATVMYVGVKMFSVILFFRKVAVGTRWKIRFSSKRIFQFINFNDRCRENTDFKFTVTPFLASYQMINNDLLI
jgi:hypothetical protein